MLTISPIETCMDTDSIDSDSDNPFSTDLVVLPMSEPD